MEYKIEVDELKTLRIWLNVEGAGEPIILQPQNPDGKEWAEPAEAESWGEAQVLIIKENLKTSEAVEADPVETPPAE